MLAMEESWVCSLQLLTGKYPENCTVQLMVPLLNVGVTTHPYDIFCGPVICL